MANATVTVKSSGGDYTSLNAALAGESADLVTNTCILTIECYAMSDTTAGTGTGYTTSSSYYINITVPTAERHSGKWNTAKYRIEGGGYVRKLTIQENYTIVDGLQVASTSFNGDAQHAIYLTGNCVTIKNNIIKHSGSTGDNNAGIFIQWTADNPHYIYNNIIYDFSGTGHKGINQDGNEGTTPSYYYNNTFVNCTCGIDSTDNSNQSKTVNNLFYLCPTCMSGTFASGSGYNATDEASLDYTVTEGATGDHTGHTFSFVDADNDDYHLASTDTGAIDLGVDLSGTFTTDIDGQTRSGSWDIGADEYVAAGGASIPRSNPFSRPFSQSLGRGGF